MGVQRRKEGIYIVSCAGKRLIMASLFDLGSWRPAVCETCNHPLATRTPNGASLEVQVDREQCRYRRWLSQGIKTHIFGWIASAHLPAFFGCCLYKIPQPAINKSFSRAVLKTQLLTPRYLFDSFNRWNINDSIRPGGLVGNPGNWRTWCSSRGHQALFASIESFLRSNSELVVPPV